MWPRHPREHPSRQKLEKRFRNESNPIPALKFRNASTTMTVYPRFPNSDPLKYCFWIQFILFCYVLKCFKCHSMLQRAAYYHEEMLTRYETIFNLEKNLKMIIWRNAKNLGWRCRYNFFIERNIKFFMATKIIPEEDPVISFVLNRTYHM